MGGVRPPAKCGTDGGYYRHLRTTKTPVCDECREAHAEAERVRVERSTGRPVRPREKGRHLHGRRRCEDCGMRCWGELCRSCWVERKRTPPTPVRACWVRDGLIWRLVEMDEEAA